MDSQSKYNFQDIFNQGSIDTQASELTIKGLNAGAIGINQTGNLVNINTGDLPEGNNLYYTDARVLGVIGGYTFPTVNANTITAGTGYFSQGVTGAEGDFTIIRFNKAGQMGSDNMLIKGITTSEKLLSIPDGYSTMFGNRNERDISIGWRSGNLTTPETETTRNISIGNRAGIALNSNATDNILIGQDTGFNLGNTAGSSRNVFIGTNSGLQNKGQNNVFLGYQSGAYNQGSGNIFIGHQSGVVNYESNKLIITNDGSDPDPFIFGDMATKTLYVHNIVNAPTGVFTNLNSDNAVISVLSSPSITGYTGHYVNLHATNLRPPIGAMNIKLQDTNSQDIIRIFTNGWTGATGYCSSFETPKLLCSTGICPFIKFSHTNDSNMLGCNYADATEVSVSLGYNSRKLTESTSGGRNVTVGWGSAKGITTGNQNCIVGFNSGNNISEGSNNLCFGAYSGQFIGKPIGSGYYTYYNAFFGFGSGLSIGGQGAGLFSANNCIFGTENFRNGNNEITTIQNNVSLGHIVFNGSASSGNSNNVLVGADITACNGSNNVCIGYQASKGVGTISNKLYIHNSPPTSSNPPLISGDFTTRTLRSGATSVLLGYNSGINNPASYGIALGFQAGMWNMGGNATAVGNSAGFTGQQADSVAIGSYAGYNTQKINAVSLGAEAGYNNQGSYSIAIGYQAGNQNQHNNTIAICAQGSALNTATQSACYISPIRTDNTTPLAPLCYTAQKEVVSNNNISVATIAGSTATFSTSMTTPAMTVSGTITAGTCRATDIYGSGISITTNFTSSALTSYFQDVNANTLIAPSHTGATGYFSAGIASTNYTGSNMTISNSIVANSIACSNLNINGVNMYYPSTYWFSCVNISNTTSRIYIPFFFTDTDTSTFQPWTTANPTSYPSCYYARDNGVLDYFVFQGDTEFYNNWNGVPSSTLGFRLEESSGTSGTWTTVMDITNIPFNLPAQPTAYGSTPTNGMKVYINKPQVQPSGAAQYEVYMRFEVNTNYIVFGAGKFYKFSVIASSGSIWGGSAECSGYISIMDYRKVPLYAFA